MAQAIWAGSAEGLESFFKHPQAFQKHLVINMFIVSHAYVFRRLLVLEEVKVPSFSTPCFQLAPFWNRHAQPQSEPPAWTTFCFFRKK